jgi:hypothetical protein
LKAEVRRRRAEGERQHQIARRARVHPTTVSALLNDALPVAAGDIRVLRLANELGLEESECFEGELEELLA